MEKQLSAPFLTIAIPTRQRVAELRELLDSIAANDCVGVEVLVSDNASTVATGAVTQDFAQRCAARGPWPRVTYVRRPEMLPYDLSVNAAVESSAGTYIWLMGDDDRLRPNALAHLKALLAEGKFETGLVNYSDWDGQLTQCRVANVFRLTQDKLGVGLAELLAPSNFWFSFMSIHVFKKQAWMDIDRSVYFRERLDNIHMYVPLVAAMKGANFITGTVLLEKRSSYLDPAYLDSADIVGSWYAAIAKAQQLGVPAEVCDLFYRTYINDFHCTRDLLAKKIRRSPIYQKDFDFIQLHYGRFPHFWVKVWPLRWLPRWLLIGMRVTFKFLRDLGRRAK
jgi:glycosyltransferase involved in cell wall biosynthesis